MLIKMHKFVEKEKITVLKKSLLKMKATPYSNLNLYFKNVSKKIKNRACIIVSASKKKPIIYEESDYLQTCNL